MWIPMIDILNIIKTMSRLKSKLRCYTIYHHTIVGMYIYIHDHDHLYIYKWKTFNTIDNVKTKIHWSLFIMSMSIHTYWIMCFQPLNPSNHVTMVAMEFVHITRVVFQEVLDKWRDVPLIVIVDFMWAINHFTTLAFMTTLEP